MASPPTTGLAGPEPVDLSHSIPVIHGNRIASDLLGFLAPEIKRIPLKTLNFGKKLLMEDSLAGPVYCGK
jgi:hypothetical protein